VPEKAKKAFETYPLMSPTKNTKPKTFN